MATLFNYNSIAPIIISEHKAIKIILKKNFSLMDFECLFEFETFINWLRAHTEVNSVIIESENEMTHSLHEQKLKEISKDKFMKYNSKICLCILELINLPQLIIFDLRKGADNLFLEFSLAADIRICSHDSRLSFNHLKAGFMPSSGLLSILPLITNLQFTKKAIYTPKSIELSDCVQSGFIDKTYSDQNRVKIINTLAAEIAELAPVQRIQSKLAMTANIKEQLERNLQNHKGLINAAYTAKDWQKDVTNNESFMSAKELRGIIHGELKPSSELDEFTAYRLKKIRENQPKQ